MANELPILIAGGGIGGLAAAYALALNGLPVRVLEQAPEFREIGAGIQLGPNVFRALEKLGLEDAVLADAHQPPAMEMRCALTGECITRIPLDDPRFFARFRLPYAVTHRHDIHGAFLKACASSSLVTLETDRTVADFVGYDALTAHVSSFPVVDRDGRLEGLVTLRRLRQLPQSKWATTTVGEVAVPLDRLAIAEPEELLVDALRRAGAGDGRVLVIEEGRLLGIVTPTDVTAALERLSLTRLGTGR